MSIPRPLLFAIAASLLAGPLSAAWGTTNETLVTISAWDFQPLNSSITTSNGVSAAPGMRFITGSGGELLAGVHIPTGALIDGVTIVACNTNPTLAINVFLVQYSDPSGPGTNIAVGSVPANSGCGSTTSPVTPSAMVDNNGSTYILDVSMQSGDDTLAFRSVKVAYRLQVSPAPGTPTFNDVPASDFGFQYIEALVASGITAGCGGGNYCPDNPVTRRQMAIFLAKALGLNFPN